jgi:hypothetical protein
MVGLEDQLDLAESAKEVKKPSVAEAEKKRQQEFYKKLRARSAEQPKGAQYK